MNSNDPIRMNDLRRPQASVSPAARAEAQRQFKYSFALVIVLPLATLTALATIPIGTNGQDGYGEMQQASSQNQMTR
jgi:hypothetical protein